MKRTLLLFAFFALLLSSCHSASETIEEGPHVWDSLLERYLHDSEVNQLLFVRYTGGSNAIAQLMVKQDSIWVEDCACDAFVGKNGLCKMREGDKKTPRGIFGVRRAFGICPDPGVSMEYVNVTENTWACDEPGPLYNCIIDAGELGRECSGEHMIKIDPEYNYGLEITYNDENIYPLGSAIFVHCKGNKVYTAGCVALDEEMMKRVLVVSDKGLKVCIFEE